MIETRDTRWLPFTATTYEIVMLESDELWALCLGFLFFEPSGDPLKERAGGHVKDGNDYSFSGSDFWLVFGHL